MKMITDGVYPQSTTVNFVCEPAKLTDRSFGVLGLDANEVAGLERFLGHCATHNQWVGVSGPILMAQTKKIIQRVIDFDRIVEENSDRKSKAADWNERFFWWSAAYIGVWFVLWGFIFKEFEPWIFLWGPFLWGTWSRWLKKKPEHVDPGKRPREFSHFHGGGVGATTHLQRLVSKKMLVRTWDDDTDTPVYWMTPSCIERLYADQQSNAKPTPT